MYLYFFKRLLLIPPTLFIIIFLNFLIIQTAPGGPVERFINQINHHKIANEVNDNNIANQNIINDSINQNSKYQGSLGVDSEIIAQIEKLYGFDKPWWQRFFLMIKKFLVFDFDQSFYQDKKVSDLILEKMPTSLSLGIWTTLIIYLISIPLGIKKAVNNNSKFDLWSSAVIIFFHAIPAFLLAIFLIILLCGGNFLNVFPLRQLTSPNFEELSLVGKIIDYAWHLALPTLSIVLGGFASLTFFCKNSFIEEISKNYVVTAYAKGLKQNQVLYRHIFRNSLLIVIANLPNLLIGVFFTSSMLIEIIFSLDGLGLLGYEAIISRDYSVIFATLYIFSLVGLLSNLISDLLYCVIDPRISY